MLQITDWLRSRFSASNRRRISSSGISGKPSSTIGFEKRWNPMLSLERDAFITALTQEIPPRPLEMARVVKANLGIED